MGGLALYFKYISMSIRSQMIYKTSFILGSIGHFFITIIEFVGILALFQRFDAIMGWTLHEIVIFYGVINVAFALAEAFARGYDMFHYQVVDGGFDRYILRPRSFILQLMGFELQLVRIGRMLQGLLVLIWGCHQLGIQLVSFETLLIVLIIIGAMFLFMGLFVLQATLSFWTIQSLELVNVFTYGGVQMAAYPISIYKEWFKKIFVYVIPTGAVTYYPMLVVLNRLEMSSLAIWILCLMPLIGILFFIVSQGIFKFGVKHYKSTGS